MPRYLYGPALILTTDGDRARNTSGGSVTADYAQTSTITDIAAVPLGAAIGTASTDDRGWCSFYGPNDRKAALWVDFGAGPLPMIPVEGALNDALDGGGGGGGGSGGTPGDDTVSTQKLVDGAVTSAKIADGTIATADLADGAVTLAKLAANSIDASKVVDGTIATAELAAASVTLAKMAADSVDASKIVDGAVGTAELAAGAVTLAKMAANSVDASKIVDGSIGTAELAAASVTRDKMSVFEPGVYLIEANYPGCTSDVFATASAARDAAVVDCFKDPNGTTTTKPRPLIVPPCPRTTAAASGSKAGFYSWSTFDFDWLTRTAMGVSSPSGTVNMGWSIQGVHGRDMYSTVGIKSPSSSNCFAFSSTYNHGDLMLKGISFTGRENLAAVNDWFYVPGGRAFYDLTLDSVGVQWYRYQLRMAAGRLTMQGTNNFNNAAGQPINIGGSDGVFTGVLYLDSRALTAGTYLFEFASETSFKVLGNIYTTPNSAGGIKGSGASEGLLMIGLEVNGLGVQAPEACSDVTKHVGAGLLGGSPSVDPATVPGLIYFDTTSQTWVKSNGSAWTLYYDGTAAVGFNGMANRLAIGSATPGKVYQNTGAEPNGTGGTNPTISYWIPWQGMWHGPSYWNKASVPTSLTSGASPTHVMTPVYVGCDSPGLYLTGTKGSVNVIGSIKLCNELPGIITNSDGAIQVVDAYDAPIITAEVGQLGSGRRALAVANSGAVGVVDVHAKIVTTKLPPGDTLSATKLTGACRVFRDGMWTVTKSSSETRANDATLTDVAGMSVYVKAGEQVVIEGELYLSSSGTPRGDVKLQWTTGGTDLTGKVTFDVLATTTSGGSNSRNSAACTTNGSGAVAGGVPNGNTTSVRFSGRLVGGTTDSTWRIQAGQNSAVITDTLTIASGSYVTARRSEV